MLLIDDIMTTGATARECARVLLRAGAAKVWVATVAKAQPESVRVPRADTFGESHDSMVARWDRRACVERGGTGKVVGRSEPFGEGCDADGQDEREAQSTPHHVAVPGTARAEALEIRAGVFRQPAMQTPVLVLNACYEPINICGARRALVLVLKGVARTEEEQGSVLHAHAMTMAMPSVIRLAGVSPHSAPDARAVRKNILLRDRNTCQYCGSWC